MSRWVDLLFWEVNAAPTRLIRLSVSCVGLSVYQCCRNVFHGGLFLTLSVDRNDCRVHSVSVSIHLRSLRRICADQWYPVVIPLNRMYQLCIMPREVFFVQYLSLKDSGACKKQIKQKNISFETLWATQHMALHASLSWVCSFTHEHLYGKWTSTFHCCRNVLPGGVNQPPPRKNPTYRVYIETSSLIRVRWYEAPIKKGWQILAYWFWEVVEESLCLSSYVRSYE